MVSGRTAGSHGGVVECFDRAAISIGGTKPLPQSVNTGALPKGTEDADPSLVPRWIRQRASRRTSRRHGGQIHCGSRAVEPQSRMHTGEDGRDRNPPSHSSIGEFRRKPLPAPGNGTRMPCAFRQLLRWDFSTTSSASQNHSSGMQSKSSNSSSSTSSISGSSKYSRRQLVGIP